MQVLTMPDTSLASPQISPEQPPVTHAPATGVVVAGVSSSIVTLVGISLGVFGSGRGVSVAAPSGTVRGGNVRAIYASRKLPKIRSDAPNAAYTYILFFIHRVYHMSRDTMCV